VRDARERRDIKERGYIKEGPRGGEDDDGLHGPPSEGMCACHIGVSFTPEPAWIGVLYKGGSAQAERKLDRFAWNCQGTVLELSKCFLPVITDPKKRER